MENQEQFDKWCDQWDEAMKKGIFDAPKNKPVPSAQTGNSNFFGITNPDLESSPKNPDIKYWQDVYELSKVYAPNSNNIDDLIQENLNIDTKKYNHNMATAANPIHPQSVGMDQDVKNPLSVGATYDVDDLQGLEDLKIKLHGLLNKLNNLEGLGQSGAKLEAKIESLKKKIDEISDDLSRNVPSGQGD